MRFFSLPHLILSVSILTLAPTSASAQTPAIGFSSAVDRYCGFERDLDLSIPAPGTTVNSSIFVDGTDSFYALACTFCVSDKNAIDMNSLSLTEMLPASWTIAPLENSEDNDTLHVAAAIQARFPNHTCWLFRAADFSFATAFDAPGEMLTLSLTANADFQFVLDSDNSGWFKTNFSSGDFEVCDSLQSVGSSPFVGVAGPAIAPEQESSWSGVKTLFR